MTETGAASRFFPTRSRGRNILHDREVAARFAAAGRDGAVVGAPVFPPVVSCAKAPAAVAIGPGNGEVWLPLLADGARGFAVEMEAGLAALLRERAAVFAGGRG